MKKIKNTDKKNKNKKIIKKISKEIGGQKGPEPTRYGDWEKNGRVTDFQSYLFIRSFIKSLTTPGSARVDMSPS